MLIATITGIALLGAITAIATRRPDPDAHEMRRRQRFVRAMSGGK